MILKENLPITLRVEEVAKIMRISKTVAYELVKSEMFPSIKIGRRIVIPRDAFLNWLNNNQDVITSE
ncbi:helix-turn-helix domain-containing protein [Priestia megaterium]|uniref:helix-turn-helix domain-containing protein n=1 Tax=Priestia megaterium TaxID=1404 RepID=UPI003D2AFDE5